MVQKVRYIELYINGQKADLESQKSLNLRFNNVLFDPEKISSSQAEYSFEFTIPSTPINDKIFDYANNLSKTGKFRSRLNAEVYADGKPIFAGTLTLNSFKDKQYSCNLVSVKVLSLDEIFGESILTDLDNWKINFNGVSTINEMNSSLKPEAIFPLVSYGAFQKSPETSDEVGNTYTSKYDMDEYNKWYVESFFPSLNMLETLKHLFNYKGYTVGGDAFTDMFLNEIYMSTNLADSQSPDYNVGNPRFGLADLNVSFTTNGNGYEQELKFPYYEVYAVGSTSQGFTSQTEYNFTSVNLFSILSEGTVTVNNTPNYLYQPEEGYIVVPTDGFYRIELSATTTLNTTGTINAKQWLVDIGSREMSEQNIDMTAGLSEITPVEIQLVRNYDENIELIKGKNNRKYANGNPNDSTYEYNGRIYNNVTEWQTCFPHEDPYSSILPTKENDLKTRNKISNLGGIRSSDSTSFGASNSSNSGITSGSGNFSGWRGGTRGSDRNSFNNETGRYYSSLRYGYIYNNGEVECFDQAVSDNFICGLSSLSGGVPAVLKNGYSWSPLTSVKNQVFAPVVGYSMLSREEGTGNLITTQTKYNENTYINTPISRCSIAGNTMTGYVSCIVWLNKNDILELMQIHRSHEKENGSKVAYSTTTNAHLKIEAFSNRSYDEIKADHTNRYEAPVEFDTQLNLANFMNKEKKMSEFVQNIIDAFNLEIIQTGHNIEINTKKKFNRNLLAAVELDNRVNSANAESSNIDYPRSMAVKYKIDTDEHGFYKSVPSDKIDLPDWKDYGDSGYSVVQLNDDTYQTSTSDKNLQFSYTWYDDFDWYAVDSGFTKTSDTPVTLSIPVISKEQYMIDGYDYSESLKHDGYGLPQRFWFRSKQTNAYVWTRTYPAEMVNIYVPVNLYTNYRDIYLNLSYKITENSLLNQYFNFTPYLASNYVTVEAYITSDEYNMIKNGSLIHLDSDIYFPVEVNGFDPTGQNPTEIKMMKKL